MMPDIICIECDEVMSVSDVCVSMTDGGAPICTPCVQDRVAEATS